MLLEPVAVVKFRGREKVARPLVLNQETKDRNLRGGVPKNQKNSKSFL